MAFISTTLLKLEAKNKKNSEDEVGALQRVVNKQKERLDGQRPNTRCRMVSQQVFCLIIRLTFSLAYQARAAIASKNRLKANNTIDKVRDFLHQLVTMLHQEGMSSDE